MAFGGGGNGGIAGASDVALSNVTADQVLSYDGGALKWQNKSLNPGGGGGLDPAAILVVSSDMPAAYKAAANAAGANVFVCSGTNDQVIINQAIDMAAPLVSRNGSSPAGAQQRGTVQLTGGFFSVSAPILLRTAVQLAGMGELTELRAVGLSSTAGYPAGVAAMVKQVSVQDHAMVVRDMWLNGNYAAGGGGCHGIVWSGPGGNATGYPSTNPDPSNHIRDVRLNAFMTGARHAIWIMSNSRGGHYHNIWVRDASGNGFWADSSPDSVLTASDFGGCETGVRIEGANWRVSSVKTYYCTTGFSFGSGRHTITGLETQDDITGMVLTGIKCVLSSITVDCPQVDGIVISGSRNSITGLAVYQRDAGRFAVTTNGIRFAGSPSDLQIVGWVQRYGSANGANPQITNTVVGSYAGARNFIRISDDSSGLLSNG